MAAGKAPTLECRLQNSLLPFGKVFRHRQRLWRDCSEAKSFGFRHAGAQLLFEPDGEVVGKFLHAVTFRAPWLEGEEPEGHRSCWRGLYVVYPSGAVCIFNCRDCDHSADVHFDDTSFSDEFMLGLPKFLGIPVPTANNTPSPPLEHELLCRWLVGDGAEWERLQAARAMSAGFNLNPWASEFVARGSANEENYFRSECLDQALGWEMRATWECPACDAESSDMRHLECFMCGLPRL